MRFELVHIVVLVLMGISHVVCAANDDVYARCSTLGPDRYADGTQVVDGEVYALVYTKRGASFSGFQADGTLVDPVSSEIALLLPMARNGRCNPTLCVLPKTFVSRRSTGAWELVLWDTRRADGVPAGVSADGILSRVKSWGATASHVDFGVSSFSFQSVASPLARPSGESDGCGVVASERSVLPPDVLPPRITGMSLEGNTVSLKVADTRPYLTYNLKGAAELGALSSTRVAHAKKDGTAAGELVIQADVSNSKFFTVVVDR